MDIEQARAVALEKRQQSPETFEKQFELLFANPHFGDVVTEVFPEVLDVYDKDGRALLKKYSDVARFLEETKDREDGIFVALHVDTESLSWDGFQDIRRLRAIALRWYDGLRAEDFEVARDDTGAPLGLAVTRTAEVYTDGWQEEQVIGRQPYAIIDSVRSAIHYTFWADLLSEAHTAGEFVFGTNDRQIYTKLYQLDHEYGVNEIGNTVLNIRAAMQKGQADL